MYHLVKKSNSYKMLSKICTVVSDDCLLHETACNTKCIGKLVLIIVFYNLLYLLFHPEFSNYRTEKF